MINRSEWLFALREDAQENWDHFIRDDFISVMQVSEAVMERQVRFSYLDLWLKGDMWLEIFLRLERAGDFCDYACIIQRDIKIPVSGDIKMVDSGRDGNNIDVSMLVNRRKSTENPQRMTPGLSSVIRLKPIYLLPGLWFEVFGASEKIPVITLLEDGEDDTFQNSSVLGCLQGQLIGDMVKGRPQIDNNISDSQAVFIQGGLPDVCPEDISRLLRIELSRDTFAVRVKNTPGLSIKHMQMMMRPLSFENGAFEWIHALYCNRERGQEHDQGQTEDPEGSRDSRPNTGRVHGQPQEGGKAGREVTPQPPEEVTSGTEPDHHLGGYTAKHTHSGSLEDA